MPNYCQNKLTVINPTPEFIEFMADGLDFQKIVPCPTNPFSDLNWCVDNWGTKWNVDKDPDLNFNKDDTICFDTAWSPPIPVIAALAAKFPDVKFTLRYFEGGNFFHVGKKWQSFYLPYHFFHSDILENYQCTIGDDYI